MLNLTKTDIAFIKANCDDSDKLLMESDVNVILDTIERLIEHKGFYGYDYNDFGREAQKVYDSIYLNN